MANQTLTLLHHTPNQPNGLVPLLAADNTPPHWGVVRVSGDDAETFLQGQLSNDITALSTHSCLAAWCDAKGRVLVSMVVLREPSNANNFLLLCRHDLLALVLQRLKMFILRSKVVLEDISTAYHIYGALGSAAQQIWQTASDDTAMHDWHCALYSTQNAHRLYIALPNTRLLILQAHPSQDDILNDYPLLNIAAWNWAEIASGVIMIEHASSGNYIPQMLNYESVGGIDFRKGCYPGQEVVARSQFRGTIKRRGYIATISTHTEAHIGDSVWCATHDAPHDIFECGTIVQISVYNKTLVIFAVLRTAAAEQYHNQQAALYLDANAQHAIQLHALPYTLTTSV